MRKPDNVECGRPQGGGGLWTGEGEQKGSFLRTSFMDDTLVRT